MALNNFESDNEHFPVQTRDRTHSQCDRDIHCKKDGMPLMKNPLFPRALQSCLVPVDLFEAKVTSAAIHTDAALFLVKCDIQSIRQKNKP